MCFKCQAYSIFAKKPISKLKGKSKYHCKYYKMDKTFSRTLYDWK